jgi:hypothetical protein
MTMLNDESNIPRRGIPTTRRLASPMATLKIMMHEKNATSSSNSKYMMFSFVGKSIHIHPSFSKISAIISGGATLPEKGLQRSYLVVYWIHY